MDKKTFALSYLKRGFSIFPTSGKKPLVLWEEYQSKKPTEELINEWWDKWPNADIAAVTGTISGIVVVDIDGGEVPQLPPTAVSQTSPGHFQYFFKHPGFPVRNSAKKIASNIDIRGDGGFVVLPPSKHLKKATGIQDFTYEWLITPKDAGFSELPAWLLDNIKDKKSVTDIVNISEEGSRNNDSAVIIGSLISKFEQNDWNSICWPLIRGWNNSYVKPPLDERELRSVFESICRREINEPSSSEPTLNIPTALEFIKEDFGDVQWLVKDLIPLAGTAIIVAKRESFKTWLALYLSQCVSKGVTMWDRLEVTKTRVLYISNDDPSPSFQSRLTYFDFNEDFYIYHRNLPDFSIDQKNGSFISVRSLIKEQNIGLVIVDILRNTHNKDSNSDKEAKEVFDKYKILRNDNHNLVILFIIHPSKEQAIEKRFGKRQTEEAVGSYYWEASVDTVISLNKTTDENDSDKVIISVTKNKQSDKKIKPFIGIVRKPGCSVEYIYEEKIPDKLKIEHAKEYILELLSHKDYSRQELVDLTVSSGICGERLIDQALRELNKEELVTHTKTKPHVYSRSEDNSEDLANRNTIYNLQNAKSFPTQSELSFMEEADEA